MATREGQAGDPAFAEIATELPAVELSFFVAAGKRTVRCADELLIFISDELSSSDGGTENPVGFAIPSS